MNTQILPNDILYLIFSFLEPLDWISVQQLSKLWNKKIWNQLSELELDINKHLLNPRLIDFIISKVWYHGKHQLRSLTCTFRNEITQVCCLTTLSTFTSLQRLCLTNVDFQCVPTTLTLLSQLTYFSSNKTLPGKFVSVNFPHWTKLRVLNIVDVPPKSLTLFQQLEQLVLDFQDIPSYKNDLHSTLSLLTRLHSLSCNFQHHICPFLPSLSSLPFLTFLHFNCFAHRSYSTFSNLGKFLPLTSIQTLELGECHLACSNNYTLLSLFPSINSAHIECRRYLRMEENKDFSSYLPQHCLTSLTIEIDPNDSQFQFDRLTHLRYLKVQRTQWASDPIKFNLHHLKYLTFLHFAPPLADQNVRLLSGLTMLKYLHCASHGISGETLHALTTLTQLTSYELPCGPNITDNDLTVLQCFGNLTNLHIWNASDIGVNALTTLTTLTNLQRVEIHSCVVKEPNYFCEALNRLTKLTSVRLDDVKEMSSEHLCNLSFLTFLTSLKLEVIPTVNDAVLQQIAKLTNLSFLELRYCGPFTFEGLQYLTTLHNVRTLMLHVVKDIEYFFVTVLPKLKHLCFLNVPLPEERPTTLVPWFRSLHDLTFFQRLTLICPEPIGNSVSMALEELNLRHISFSIQSKVGTTKNSYKIFKLPKK